MGQPITWRNVHGPNLADAAARPMEMAQRSMNSVFDQFASMIKQTESLNAGNAAAERNNNTQAFLSEISKYRTPEALQAAMASGEIDRLRAGFGSNIDQAAIRGSVDSLLKQRMEQATQANQYADTTRDRNELPIADQIAALSAAGKTKEAQALLDQHNLRREAGLALGITQARDAATQREREGIKFNRDGEAHRSGLARDAAATAASVAHTENARYALQTNKEDRTKAVADRERDIQAAIIKRQREALLKDNPFMVGSADPALNAEELRTFVGTSLKDDPDRASAILAAMGKNSIHTYKNEDGQEAKIAIPLPVWQEALNGVDTKASWFDGTAASDVVARARSIMETKAMRDKARDFTKTLYQDQNSMAPPSPSELDRAIASRKKP